MRDALPDTPDSSLPTDASEASTQNSAAPSAALPSPEPGVSALGPAPDFDITVTTRHIRGGDGQPAKLDKDAILVWGAIHAPRPGLFATATIDLAHELGCEILAIGLPDQRDQAERALQGAARFAIERKLTLAPGKAHLFPPFAPLGPLARGSLLVAPTCYPHEFFATRTPHLWAIPLWPDEVQLLRAFSVKLFIATIAAQGFDIFDHARPSVAQACKDANATNAENSNPSTSPIAANPSSGASGSDALPEASQS